MFGLKWKKHTALMLAIMLVAALFGPIRSTASAAVDQPKFVSTIADEDFIATSIDPPLKDPGNFNVDDFLVKVNGYRVLVTSVAPSHAGGTVPFMFLFLERKVVKGEEVTLQYVNEDDPLTGVDDPETGEVGKPLSNDIVQVKNMKRGSFQTSPTLEMPLHVNYKFRANAPILTFSPTGQGNRVQFIFPNSQNNDAGIETNGHDKTDYVIIDNSDSKSYTPSRIWITPSLNTVDVMLGPGEYLEEGKTYTLAMSNTAGGKEVRLPSMTADDAEAMVTLFKDDGDGIIAVDEYRFIDLALTDSGNRQPMPESSLSANLDWDGSGITYAVLQLATDDDGDVLTLSNPRSSDTSVAIAVLDEEGQLYIEPAGPGSTLIQVDVSDDYADVTVDIAVHVNARQTNALSSGDFSIINNETGDDYVMINNVRTGAVLKVYDASNHTLATYQQAGNGILMAPIPGGILVDKVYLTVTEVKKLESEKTEAIVPPVVDKQALSAAITSAQWKYDHATEGEADGQYANGSMDDLLWAIRIAGGAKTSPTVSQTQVNAALNALNNAVLAFDVGKVTVDRSALGTAIQDAQDLHDDAVEGQGYGQYAPGSKKTLQDAINAANAVWDTIAVTQAQVDAAVIALNAAVATFDGAKVQVDKTQLAAAIAAAQAKHDSANEGKSNGQYKPGAKADLQIAIDAAKAVSDDPLATKEQVEAALKAMNQAVAHFATQKISNSGGNGSGNGSGGGSVDPEREGVRTDIISNGTVIGSVVIKPSKDAEGRLTASLDINKELVASLIERLKAVGNNTFTLNIQAGIHDSDLFFLTISPEAAALWSGNGLTARLNVNGLGVAISAESLKVDHQVQFKVELDHDIDGVQKRATGNANVTQTAGDGRLRIIGTPVSVETDAKLPITLFLPIGNATLSSEQLDDTGIYMEHSDGTQEVITGTYMPASGEWGQAGIRFDVSRLSLFALAEIDGWKQFRDASPNEQPAKGYVTGYPGGYFKPNNSITRAELAALLAKAVDREATHAAIQFRDVPASHWASATIERVVRMGLMTGDPDGGFRPDEPITRAEIAVIAAKFAADKQPAKQASFPDIAGHWASQAILIAASAGYLNGYEDGTFQPERELSRAETVVIINKLLGIAPDASGKAKFLDVPQSHWAFGAIQAASAAR